MILLPHHHQACTHLMLLHTMWAPLVPLARSLATQSQARSCWSAYCAHRLLGGLMLKGALVCVLTKLERVMQSVLRPASMGVQAWERTSWAAEWCRELGLDLRGMRFAKDVRRQLETIAGADGASLLKAADRVPGGAAAPDAPGERARKRRRTEDKGAHPLRMLAGCWVDSMSIGETLGMCIVYGSMA